MFTVFKSHPRYVIAAVIVHLVVGIFFAVSFHWTSSPTGSLPPIIQVHTVTENQIQEIVRSPKAVETPKTDPKDEAAARRQRAEEQKKLQEAERRKEAERKKVALEQERVRQQQKQAEDKRQEELKRAQQFKEKIAAEQKRVDEDQKRQEQLQQERQRQQAEAIARQAEAKRQATIIDKYEALMHQKVKQNWIQPPSSKKKVCIVKINMIPTGDVMDITIISGSGDPVFDRSVIHAIKKSSPLPVPPPEVGLFNVFRELNFEFGTDS